MPPRASSTTIRLDRPDRRELTFELVPGPEERAALAEALELSALRKLRFAGHLAPEGARDWVLEATLGATVVQPCGITLEPVTTRIDDPVTRRYAAAQTPDRRGGEQGPGPGAEIEMPDDTDTEPLPAALDLAGLMAEALALAVPAFPRAPGAELGEIRATAPGAAPIEDAALKPFAGLAKALGDAGDD
ncbi:DUF177 domain-containing protein [Palleronia sediminis]|uniref:DUF177 domain-containing protein n=1 Tax=Palleronia sediminis TaxID=2547833 RepID=A0A4R6APY0_9RHOB|nr:YceD family protein [Palleronia sediminis]TDL83723.1 DUF177 domain-containing protein [Palleronia sediminis]